jgi:hypothetical protein
MDAVLNEVTGWVEKQPKFLQQNYKQVLEKGSVKDKQELIDYYRSQVKAPTVSSQQGGTKASSEADSLQPVQTRRSGAPATDSVDPTDEKAAWADALKGI